MSNTALFQSHWNQTGRRSHDFIDSLKRDANVKKAKEIEAVKKNRQLRRSPQSSSQRSTRITISNKLIVFFYLSGMEDHNSIEVLRGLSYTEEFVFSLVNRLIALRQSIWKRPNCLKFRSYAASPGGSFTGSTIEGCTLYSYTRCFSRSGRFFEFFFSMCNSV